MKEKVYTLDFTKVNHFLEVQHIIKDSLNFPEYYGYNWDAFWDCLHDLEDYPMRIKIIGLEELSLRYSDMADKLLEILKKFKYQYPAITNIFIIEIITISGARVYLN